MIRTTVRALLFDSELMSEILYVDMTDNLGMGKQARRAINVDILSGRQSFRFHLRLIFFSRVCILITLEIAETDFVKNLRVSQTTDIRSKSARRSLSRVSVVLWSPAIP